MSDISGERITRIERLGVHSPRPRDIGFNSRIGAHGTVVHDLVVRVHTASGAVGVGWSPLERAAAESLLGRRLGLSTLVVLLSLVFWGWVWGPMGMLLAVPLTMMVKIALENTEDLRWVAVMLDANPSASRAPTAPATPDVSPAASAAPSDARREPTAPTHTPAG